MTAIFIWFISILLLLFTDVDYFSCAKCSYHSPLMFVWFSCTETYQWIVHTSSSLVSYWCWHIFIWKMFQIFNITIGYLLMLIIFHVQNVLIILDWCFVIFLSWNISMNCMDFIFIGYLLMLTYFHIQYCYWLLTDYFLCAKCSYYSRLMFMWICCTEIYPSMTHTSPSLVIYWCW